MVSEETQRLGQSSEEKKNESEEKKRGASIFGSSEEKKQDPTGSQAVSSGDRQSSSEGERGNKNSSQLLKKTEEVSSEKKEDEMPLDDEGKKYVSDTVEEKLSPLKQKLGALDKVTQVIEANKKTLQAIQEKVSTNSLATETEPKETRIDPEEVARRAIRMIREEDQAKREEREQEETRKREREEHQQLVEYCLRNPEAKECKTLPDTVRKIVDEILKKQEEGAPKAEKKELQAKPALEPLEPMTAERRKAYTEEQNKQRNEQAVKLMNKLNITYQDAWNMLERSPEDLETVKQKILSKMSDSDFEQLIKSQSEAQKGQIVGVLCEGGECKVEYKDKGFIAMSEDDLKKLVDKKVEEELKKVPHI